MALTLIRTTATTETVRGMEVCACCAVLVSTGQATDRHGGIWSIGAESPLFEVSHCDLCRNPLGADRVSASVTL